MKNNSNKPSAFVHAMSALLALVALQLPIIGHCDSASGWENKLLESNTKKVAVKAVELHEDKEVGFWRDEIWGLAFSPDGRYLATTSTTNLKVSIWDWQNKRIVRTLEKAQGAGMETDIRYSPDGHLLVACHSRAAGDILVRIWNTETWAVTHDITDSNPGSCNGIGFSPDGKSLIGVFQRSPTKPGDSLVVYGTTSWQPVWGLRTVPFYPKALILSPDGKYVAIGGAVINPRRWPQDGQPITPVPVFGSPPLADQSLIAIVDMAQHAIVRTLQNTVSFDLGHLDWSPDGTQVAAIGRRASDYSISQGKEFFTSGPDTVMVFDASTGKHIAGEQVEGVGGGSLHYTPDGKFVIEGFMIGRGSGRVRIWDGQHRELLQEIPGEVGSLAVSRDGHYLAVGEVGKTIVWRLK